MTFQRPPLSTLSIHHDDGSSGQVPWALLEGSLTTSSILIARITSIVDALRRGESLSAAQIEEHASAAVATTRELTNGLLAIAHMKAGRGSTGPLAVGGYQS